MTEHLVALKTAVAGNTRIFARIFQMTTFKSVVNVCGFTVIKTVMFMNCDIYQFQHGFFVEQLVAGLLKY